MKTADVLTEAFKEILALKEENAMLRKLLNECVAAQAVDRAKEVGTWEG